MSNTSLNDKAKQLIEPLQNKLGFTLWGTSEFSTPQSIDFYKTWLDRGYHGEMKYLEDHLPLKADPNNFSAQKKTHFKYALVFAFPYIPHPEANESGLQSLNIAKYARGQDYHSWLKLHLDEIALQLKGEFPQDEFLTATDSMPILERDLAYRAGLGWFGKNTCIIHPKQGSFFLIGEILTTLNLKANSDLSHDFCGSCTKCMDSCPTQAILPDKVIDATKCISYLTIESKAVPTPDLRKKMGDWFFGCDVCQDVCPWNIKALKAYQKPNTQTNKPTSTEEELRFILINSGKTLQKKFAQTPLSRSRPFGLKRNAIIVATNLNLKSLMPEILALKADSKLEELCNWSLKLLSSNNEL